MKLSFPFAATERPTIDQVGGKALALITMTGEGLPVPPGFVLSVAFFEPWSAALQATPEWAALQNNEAETLVQSARAIQSLCRDLVFNREQREELDRALGSFQAAHPLHLFAVRSSSPEEDLESASFAGGYETTLGVTLENLEAAILHSFASSFDTVFPRIDRGSPSSCSSRLMPIAPASPFP